MNGYISISVRVAMILLVVSGLFSCGKKTKEYYSGNLREEGVFGRVTAIESEVFVAGNQGEEIIKAGKAVDVHKTLFDEKGIKIFDSNEGNSGNYSMTFSPKYSTNGILTGGEYHAGETLLFTRQLVYNDKGNVVSAFNFNSDGIIIDSLIYDYEAGKHYCISEGVLGGVHVKTVYSPEGYIVSKNETDGSTYRIDYVYDKRGRLIEKNYMSAMSSDNGDIDGDSEIKFIPEYNVNYVYDNEDRLIEETKRNTVSDDGFDYNTKYSYENYDEYGNWLRSVRHNVYADGTDTYYIVERTIEYYPADKDK